jgi:hypothetical protein
MSCPLRLARVACLVSVGLYCKLAWAQTVSADDSTLRGASFVGGTTFSGNGISGWHTLGDAQWTANGGVITGKASSTPGWLVLDHSYQDVGFYSAFRCDGDCETGVMTRLSKSRDGMTGTIVSIHSGKVEAEKVLLDSKGEIAARSKLRNASGTIRFAPPPSDPNAVLSRPQPVPPPAGVTMPIARPRNAFRPGAWNEVEILLDSDILRSYLNDSSFSQDGTLSAATDDVENDFGPIALYVGKNTSVTFKNLVYKDLALVESPRDEIGKRFHIQRLTPYYYNWSAVAADFNRDGQIDIASGPYIYYGPAFTTKREIYPAQTVNPSNSYATFVQHVADFNGDGWPDIVATNLGSNGATLYINPGLEPRRWKQYHVVPSVQSEDSLLSDVDGDGKPELVYIAENFVRYAKPDPANPTGLWQVHTVSEKGPWSVHGIGVGDVNGDKLIDIVGADGWWEHPAAGDTSSTWKYHPVAFGRWGRIGEGGATIGVYDINGDGLNDVITSLEAHGWGLAWFEQKRAADGTISFVEHMVMDNHNTNNAGGVAFSELHGSAVADVDGDGIPDFIVGKRVWSHNDDNFDPDVYGPAVLYWYRTVRDSKAPGGARFIPELIDNTSGAGSDVLAYDINGDGAIDIVSATKRGAYIYWGTKKTTK